MILNVGILLAQAICPSAFGIAGGSDSGGASAYFLQSGGEASPLDVDVIGGEILSASINGYSVGLIGGTTAGSALAYFVRPDGSLSDPLLTISGTIYGTALNQLGIGLIGGTDGVNAVAYRVAAASETISANLLPAIVGQVNAVAINDVPIGLIVGTDSAAGAFAFRMPAVGPVVQIVAPMGFGSEMLTADINSGSSGLIGGHDVFSNPTAYTVSPAGIVSANLLTGLTSGQTNSVAINDAGTGFVGGVDSNGGFLYQVSYGGVLSAQLLPALPNQEVTSVAVNASGVGIAGGGGIIDSPFVYFINPDLTLSAQALPSLPAGRVSSVDINDFGAGIVLGAESISQKPFGYLLHYNGSATPLNFPAGTVFVNTGAMIQALSAIPTPCLPGNLSTVADYINQYAPQLASYFLPSLVDGSLEKAVQSVSPMRNAFALVTADQNIFMLNTGLSRHLRDHRLFRRDNNWEEEEIARGFQSVQLLADRSALRKGSETTEWSYWMEVIGSMAYQKEQQQAQAFDPITGGIIFAWEFMQGPWSQVGIGTAYTYTDIHEQQGGGNSTMHQPYLFLYGLVGGRRAYLDAAVWAGLFYIHHERHIHITGFDSVATSNPHGWQLAPHVEVGQEIDYLHPQVLMEPFLMLDWANAWQGSYRETGSNLFNMGQKKHYSSLLRGEAGIRFYETLDFDGWTLTFQEKVSYVNKTSFGAGKVKAFLVGSPGSFTVETLSAMQNIGVGEFALIFASENPTSPYACLAYQGEFSPLYQSHQVLFEMNWNF